MEPLADDRANRPNSLMTVLSVGRITSTRISTAPLDPTHRHIRGDIAELAVWNGVDRGCSLSGRPGSADRLESAAAFRDCPSQFRGAMNSIGVRAGLAQVGRLRDQDRILVVFDVLIGRRDEDLRRSVAGLIQPLARKSWGEPGGIAARAGASGNNRDAPTRCCNRRRPSHSNHASKRDHAGRSHFRNTSSVFHVYTSLT